MKRKTLASALFLIFLITALSIAGTIPPGPNMLNRDDITEQANGVKLNSEQDIDKLSIDYKMWVSAHMAGNRDESIRLEKNIFSKISMDLSASEYEVRKLAKFALMSDSKIENSKTSNHKNNDKEFEAALKALNTKESIYRTLIKNDGFSSKYRLLGDYIEILRRELNMPRLKFASAPAPEDAIAK